LLNFIKFIGFILFNLRPQSYFKKKQNISLTQLLTYSDQSDKYDNQVSKSRSQQPRCLYYRFHWSRSLIINKIIIIFLRFLYKIVLTFSIEQMWFYNNKIFGYKFQLTISFLVEYGRNYFTCEYEKSKPVIANKISPTANKKCWGNCHRILTVFSFVNLNMLTVVKLFLFSSSVIVIVYTPPWISSTDPWLSLMPTPW
jgi:hypothetical protein